MLVGGKSVQSTGGDYMLMIRDNLPRFNAVNFMRSKDEVAKYFSRYLAGYRFPCVCADDAAEFKGEAFIDLCRERGIREDFITRGSPQFNVVADRGIAMIESADKAAATQARLMFPIMVVPSNDPLWTAQAYWGCHALNLESDQL